MTDVERPDKKKKKKKSAAKAAANVRREVGPTAPTVPAQAATTSAAQASSKPKRKPRQSLAAKRAPDAESADVAPAVSRADWSTVVRKGATKKTVQPQVSSRPPPPKRKPKASRLRAPRKEAVVITLLPNAAEERITYAEVIRRMKSRVALADLGLHGPKFREAATGALVVEVPDAEKADALAAKFREEFESDVLRVARPVKSAELRLHGLDPSVTEEEVVAAVASTGACDAAAVKCGTISRVRRSGIGTVWVRCPVLAAKTIARGQLTIGWTSARVEVLRQRPRMCYRCLETGHIGACCKSEKDRGGVCYQCGEGGHKAASCSAKPRCVVCADYGRDANHRCGRASCLGPKKRKPPDKGAEQVQMDT